MTCWINNSEIDWSLFSALMKSFVVDWAQSINLLGCLPLRKEKLINKTETEARSITLVVNRAISVGNQSFSVSCQVCNRSVSGNAFCWLCVPAGSPSRGLCLWHKPTELAHSFLFCSCFYFCLYGPFNCILFHTFSRRLLAFPLCSSGLISALLVLSTVSLFMKVSLNPDTILCDWLGSKHPITK